jgi:hypothetical protein
VASRKVQAKIARLIQGKGASYFDRKNNPDLRSARNKFAKDYLQNTKSRVPKTKSLARRLLDKGRKIIGLHDKDTVIKENRSDSARHAKFYRKLAKSDASFKKNMARMSAWEARIARHSEKRNEISSQRTARIVKGFEPSPAYKRRMERSLGRKLTEPSPKPVERKTAIKAKPTQKAKRMGMK